MPQRVHPGIRPVDDREDARRRARRREGGRDDLAGELRQVRVPRVSLEHHGVPRRERAGGVAAGDGEREREVARGEDEHRADALELTADVGARRPHRIVGDRVIDACIEPGPLGEHIGEQAQLECRALQFTPQPRLGEMRLAAGEKHEVVGTRIQALGHRAQGLAPDGDRGGTPGG
ncbi:hypothetical protein QE367_001890 [Microbacterium paludicola]|uniref:Uncharacterized protein n=1 Tax=Microbacterium paludicola TaxID=300019 RepID=A0ABU1I210_9MICO|nr:hypothetical protein [Microbacterium paludicola]